MSDAEKGGAPEQDGAPFDDSRKALEFALNAHQVSLPQPFMNKAMAAAKPKRRKSRDPGVRKLQDLQEEIDAERAAHRTLKHGQWPTKGLDGAHLAGFILAKFGTLTELTQVVLTGRLTRPVMECTCGNPCCSGWRPVGRWVGAVDRMCELAKYQALAIANEGRIPGAPMRAGLSTQPALRRAIVKAYFTGDDVSVSGTAARHGLDWHTVARHRGWLTEWMATLENNGWLEVDALFDHCGITGPFG